MIANGDTVRIWTWRKQRRKEQQQRKGFMDGDE
jgi:hypothetical protein